MAEKKCKENLKSDKSEKPVLRRTDFLDSLYIACQSQQLFPYQLVMVTEQKTCSDAEETIGYC